MKPAAREVAAEEEQHMHPRRRRPSAVFDDVGTDALIEARARWAAATVVLAYMARTGLTSHAEPACPFCDCPVHYVHEIVPFAVAGSNEWTGYECIRCGATHTLADAHPWAILRQADLDRLASRREEEVIAGARRSAGKRWPRRRGTA